MKRSVNSFLLSKLLWVIPVIISAAEYKGVQPLSDVQHNIILQLSGYMYQEPSVMRKQGIEPFVGVGFYTSLNQNYGGFSFNSLLQYGQTKYEGSGATTHDETVILTAELKHFLKYKSFKILYGVGYRRLHDYWGNKVTSTGKYTYDRRSDYLYPLAGIHIETDHNQAYRFVYKHLMQGLQKSYLGSIEGQKNVNLPQNSGFGFETEYFFNNNFSTFLDFWNINKSSISTRHGVFTEPYNYTISAGIRLSLEK